MKTLRSLSERLLSQSGIESLVYGGLRRADGVNHSEGTTACRKRTRLVKKLLVTFDNITYRVNMEKKNMCKRKNKTK